MTSRFNRTAAPATPTAPATPARGAASRPARGGSRWKGVTSAAPRAAFPLAGSYVFQVIGTEYGYNPKDRTESFKVKLRVLDNENDPNASPVGSDVAVVEKLGGTSGEFGEQRTKAFAVAAAGCESDAEYDALDPEGVFLDRCGDAGEQPNAGLNGRLLAARVSRGNDVLDKKTKEPTGDYYRVYAWSVIDEEDQEVKQGDLFPPEGSIK